MSETRAFLAAEAFRCTDLAIEALQAADNAGGLTADMAIAFDALGKAHSALQRVRATPDAREG